MVAAGRVIMIIAASTTMMVSSSTSVLVVPVLALAVTVTVHRGHQVSNQLTAQMPHM
jgi:hypothetical protein